MSFTTYNRALTIDDQFKTILTAQGYVATSSTYFLNQLLTVLKRAYKDQFAELYSIASQVDISRAAGEFLDRWGSVLAQPRTSASYANDMTLSNVRVQISPTALAKDITTDGLGLTVPAGAIIRDAASTILFKAVDPIVIDADADGVYIRVISLSPGELTVPAGTLTVVEFPIAETGSLIANGASSYSLAAVQSAAISGGTNILDDETYRSILSAKSQSWGLINDQRFQTLMAVEDLVTVTLKEVPGGVHIYLDTKHPSLDEMVTYIAKQVITAFNTRGLHFAAFTPIYRPVTVKLQLNVDTSTSTTYDKVQLTGKLQTQSVLAIANSPMGATLDLTSILTDVADGIDGIESIVLQASTYNGKTVIADTIPQQFNEKAQLSITGMTVV